MLEVISALQRLRTGSTQLSGKLHKTRRAVLSLNCIVNALTPSLKLRYFKRLSLSYMINVQRLRITHRILDIQSSKDIKDIQISICKLQFSDYSTVLFKSDMNKIGNFYLMGLMFRFSSLKYMLMMPVMVKGF